MKLHMQSPHEVKYGPYGLWGQKVKGQGHNARIARLGKMVSSAQLLPLYTYLHETSHAVSPMSRGMDPMDLRVKKVKGQGHNVRITENGFLRITASPLHLSL